MNGADYSIIVLSFVDDQRGLRATSRFWQDLVEKNPNARMVQMLRVLWGTRTELKLFSFLWFEKAGDNTMHTIHLYSRIPTIAAWVPWYVATINGPTMRHWRALVRVGQQIGRHVAEPMWTAAINYGDMELARLFDGILVDLDVIIRAVSHRCGSTGVLKIAMQNARQNTMRELDGLLLNLYEDNPRAARIIAGACYGIRLTTIRALAL